MRVGGAKVLNPILRDIPEGDWAKSPHARYFNTGIIADGLSIRWVNSP